MSPHSSCCQTLIRPGRLGDYKGGVIAYEAGSGLHHGVPNS